MKELSGYSDDDLLAALDKARDRKGRITQEIEARFTERGETVIETEHWTATQRQDTERYVFSRAGIVDLIDTARASIEQGNPFAVLDAARQISRPYVSLSKREPEETPI